MKTSKVFKLLKILAEDADKVASSRHAACIMYRGDIIAFGVNKIKSHPFAARFSKNSEAIYFHAETSAIYNALKKIDVDELKKCKLFVLRIKSDGSIGSSCPCPGCARAIATFNIPVVYHSNDGDIMDFSGELK